MWRLSALLVVGVLVACSPATQRSYESEGGGLTSVPIPSGWELTVDVDDEQALDAVLVRAYPVIENALPTAVEVARPSIGYEDGAGEVDWAPGGRPTKMPPDSHGPGVVNVSLLVGRFLATGEPLAEIRYGVDRTVENIGQTPFPSPSNSYYYHLDPQAFRDVIALVMAPVGTPAPSN